jgi:GTP-binding protein
MFIDRVEIVIKAGNGGNGHTSFHRDKITQRGGPNGGDGGNGGDIIFVGSTRVDNLIDFRFTKHISADDGESGKPGMKDGSYGAHKTIAVPLGTKIYKMVGGESATGDSRLDTEIKKELIADITADGQTFLALRGGAGGRGNPHFATARRQTPNFSQQGVKTKPYTVILELESIADVGIIGFPNVGKSTFLSVVTRANPKIANYPFTTLHPNIGVYSAPSGTVIFADIPGLVEGAADGVGLGIDFLKHINRTRILLHIVDISEQDGRDAFDDYGKINAELEKFSPELLNKKQIVVLNKIDCAALERIEKFKKQIGNVRVFEISAVARMGLDELLTFVAAEVLKTPKVIPNAGSGQLEDIVDKNDYNVRVTGEGIFIVDGPMIENLIRGVVLSDTESRAYFYRRLQKSGVIKSLKDIGMTDGDTVSIADTEFIWED